MLLHDQPDATRPYRRRFRAVNTQAAPPRIARQFDISRIK
jgi:hypothetical protein